MAILKIRDNNGNVTVIPALEGRSAYQIAVKYGFVGTEEEWVKGLGQSSLVGTKEYWSNNLTTVPERGQFVIITDYKTKEENGELIFVPGIKVGNGIDSVDRLPIISGSADKLEHTITIGEHVFDGTSDVIVEVYNGEMSNDDMVLSMIPIMQKQLEIKTIEAEEGTMDTSVEMQSFTETFSPMTLEREE